MADLYKKNLLKISALHDLGEGAVRSFIKRHFMTFDEGNVVDSKSIISEFADYGFDRVLKSFAEGKMDFKSLKSVETGAVLEETVLDNCLRVVKGYNPDCLNVIIKEGMYSKTDLTKSFIHLCQLHQSAIKENAQTINCFHLDSVFEVFLDNGMDLNEDVDGQLAFHALCDLYVVAKKQNMAPAYQKMLKECVQRCLDEDVDLNAVDSKNRTAFSINDMEMKSRFVRFQKMKEDKRLLDLFMIMNQVLTGGVTDESKALVKKHIVDLQQDVSNYAKRARFINEMEDR